MIIIRYSKIAGSSLFEVLIALFITSVVFYKIFDLSLYNINSNRINHNYLQAIILMQDIANRIQANTSIAQTTSIYHLDEFFADNKFCTQNTDISYCRVNWCSDIEIAEYDLKLWKNELSCRLQRSLASIENMDIDGITTYKITIKFINDFNKEKLHTIQLYQSI